ncbi:MAG TPA: sugar phosphate isomerase/epimerase family protein [Candidatus Dormibacteraeota bacterium]|nr:sugar phosphate isomerase/epimerase family protein [Candidatus Dormibacteraeota bacterium]
MLIGTMNHPGRDLVKEIEWMGSMGFGFIDLTFEPPSASVERVDLRAVRDALHEHNLRVVGHTAYYLPLCSPFESLRRAAVEELKLCLEAFAQIGASWMNLHPDSKAPLHERKFVIERNIQTIRELLVPAKNLGLGLMIENLPGSFNTVRQLSELLGPIPELGLHLDIGHANLLVESNTTDDLLAAFPNRLRHVHLHDNKGGSADLHLPLGSGNIDTRHYIRSLQAAGYDGPITLEVFTPDRHFLSYSRDVLRRIWDEEAMARHQRAQAQNQPTREPAAVH